MKATNSTPEHAAESGAAPEDLHAPRVGPAGQGQSNSAVSAEVECLKERIRKLEEAREQDHQTLAALQTECEAFRKALSAWAWQQVSDEDLKRWLEEDDRDSVPLDQFLGELEKIVEGS